MRVLGLRYINPNGTLCFLFVEGTIGLAILLALAEQVSWWAVVVLPLSVAAMVKINDLVAAALVTSGGSAPPVVGRAKVAPAGSDTMPRRAAVVREAVAGEAVAGEAVVREALGETLTRRGATRGTGVRRAVGRGGAAETSGAADPARRPGNPRYPWFRGLAR